MKPQQDRFAKLIFVDCEAPFGCASPASGNMTEFGAVHMTSGETFHGKDSSSGTMKLFRAWIDRLCPNGAMFISDNPAYDWQWINFYFDRYSIGNPFGFSARRIGDFYAGLVGDFFRANEWKSLRITKHDHMPVNDAMGNCEAFRRILDGEEGKRR